MSSATDTDTGQPAKPDNSFVFSLTTHRFRCTACGGMWKTAPDAKAHECSGQKDTVWRMKEG